MAAVSWSQVPPDKRAVECVLSTRKVQIVDSSLRRVAAAVNRYPASASVLERFVFNEPEARSMVIDNACAAIGVGRDPAITTISGISQVVDVPTLGQIALTLVLHGLHTTVFKGSGFLARELTKHAYATAYGAQWIAQKLNWPHEEAWCNGLLFRIGIPILAQWDSEGYAGCIARMMGSRVLLWNAERAQFGIDHFDVQQAFSEMEPMPEWFCKSNAKGTLPTSSRRAAELSSHVAHTLGCDMGMASTPNPVTPRQLSLAKLTEDDLPELQNCIREAMARFQKLPMITSGS